MKNKNNQTPETSGIETADSIYARVHFLTNLKVFAFVILSIICIYLSARHISDELWYDEAYTFDMYASPAEAFSNYSTANNHILFSAAIAVLRDIVTYTDEIRYILLISFIASTFLLFLAGRKLGGQMAGWLSALLFATSHVTLNFALQIRGYGPSWLPVAAALLFAIYYLENRKWPYLAGYIIASITGAGIIPTNLAIFAPLAVWAALTSLFKINVGENQTGTVKSKNTKAISYENDKLSISFSFNSSEIIKSLLLLLSPLAGLLFYAGVWNELIATGKNFTTEYTTIGIFADLYKYSFMDLITTVIVPFVILLIFYLFIKGNANLFKDHSETKPTIHKNAIALSILFTAVILIPVLAILTLPNTPMPRTLVPLLPLLYLMAGTIFTGVFEAICHKLQKGFFFPMIFLGLCLVLITSAARRESNNAGYLQRHTLNERPQNIYDQYYHQNFDPFLVMESLGKLSTKHDAVVAMTDDSDLWSLNWAYNILVGEYNSLALVHFEASDLSKNAKASSPDTIFVAIAFNHKRAVNIFTSVFGPQASDIVEIGNFGFFKVYAQRKTLELIGKKN